MLSFTHSERETRTGTGSDAISGAGERLAFKCTAALLLRVRRAFNGATPCSDDEDYDDGDEEEEEEEAAAKKLAPQLRFWGGFIAHPTARTCQLLLLLHSAPS